MSKFFSLISQIFLVISVALVMTITVVPEAFVASAFAQERQSVKRATAAKPLRVAPSSLVNKMPNVTFDNICDPSKARARGWGKAGASNKVTITCTPSNPTAASSTLATKPDVQRSEINCKYTDDGDGGLAVDSCTCTADKDSNCTGFITWCAKQGADVGGNNTAATCD